MIYSGLKKYSALFFLPKKYVIHTSSSLSSEYKTSLLSSFSKKKKKNISGYAGIGIIQSGILSEEMHFLQKPFRPKELAAKVSEILDM